MAFVGKPYSHSDLIQFNFLAVSSCDFAPHLGIAQLFLRLGSCFENLASKKLRLLLLEGRKGRTTDSD